MPTSLLSVNPPPKCPPVSWREIPHLHSTARGKHEETARSLPVPSGVRKTQRVISQHDLEGAVRTRIDVVPTDHIAGSGLVVNSKVYGDLAGGEVSGRLGGSDDVAAVSIGETIGADDLEYGRRMGNLIIEALDKSGQKAPYNIAFLRGLPGGAPDRLREERRARVWLKR